MTDLLRLAVTDPSAAHARALALLPSTDDRPLVLRAAALAANELGLLDEGLHHLDQALAEAESSGRSYAAAQIRMNLVGLLAARGDIPDALAAAARAEGVLAGEDADRLAANLAGALARAGRLAEAHAAAAPALPRLRSGGDPVTLIGLLTNLGLARALHADLPLAESLLAEAVAVGSEARLQHQTAMARANLAYVVSRRGNVSRALRLYAEAEPDLTGERLAQTRLDQAETLIGAGFPAEARPLLGTALADAAAHGYACDVADGLLLLAHAELSDGDPERAAATAERARAAFAAQERTGWMLLAEHLLLRARWAEGDRSTVLLRTATATAERLERGGWLEASAEARIIAARVALHLKRPAGHLLAPLSRASTNGPASLRAAAYHAIALERWARHDRPGALSAVWSGLHVLEEHADALGAADLRARAAGLGSELAALGHHLARSARELLTAEERRRGLARLPLTARTADPERAALLTELRETSARHTTLTAGGRSPSSTRLDELESKIRTTTRRRSVTHPSYNPGLPAVISALGDRALVEYVQIGADLHAVTVSGGRPRRHHLGTFAEVTVHTNLIRAASRRLAAAPHDDQAQTSLAQAAIHLEKLLIGPLCAAVADREPVIAPAGALHTLPWAALPSLAYRPFTVVPSATSWLLAHRQRPTGNHVVLTHGPNLTHAAAEIRALRQLHPAARTPGRAEDVRAALNHAGLAHLAAHGEFRDGNALFSRLHLADGPLMGYDLEELEAPPHIVVLSACDLGRVETDSVTGMVGTLLALGTATVIASVTPVRDEATPPFMLAFHQALAAGDSPARALAAAPRTPGITGFQCFGSG
ncbi:CHAT domain-containing protein [Spirillospora sp. NPDC048911]|uniref:CHAT domain-containing protein n=1 Tax=Spirillospora sp. NPDC048911 TaxID=3364527 RepID=UPI003723CB7E